MCVCGGGGGGGGWYSHCLAVTRVPMASDGGGGEAETPIVSDAILEM